MAYNSVIKINPLPDGFMQILIDETDCETDSEVIIPRAPRFGLLWRVKCCLISGDATLLTPVLGITTEPAGRDIVFKYLDTDTETTEVDLQPAGRGAIYRAPSGILYHRSGPDDGTNNVIKTEYIFDRKVRR